MPETIDQKNGGKRRELLTALVFSLAQAIFFIGWIWTEWNPSGVEIRVATGPVDPRDIFRGQYLELSYLFDEPGAYPLEDEEAPNREEEEIYAALAKNDSTGLHEPVAFASSSAQAKALADVHGAPDPVIMRGRFRAWNSRFDFGVNRYFVPEGTPEPPRNKTVALLLVPKNMRPRLIGLEVDGKLWKPERIEPED